MDTRWMRVINEHKGKIFTVSVAGFCLVAAFVIVRGIFRVYYPLLSGAFAAGMGYLMVVCVRWLLKRVDDRHREKEPLDYYQKLEFIRWSALIASCAYMGIFIWLGLYQPYVHIGIGYMTSLIQDLILYRMTWIVNALMFGPVLCAGLPAYLGASVRISALVKELYGLSRTREELMEELREQTRSAVEERVKSERMKIDLITNVSHDLKTPLTSVIGYIELMKKEESSAAMQDYLAVLTRKTEVLKNMIENVFELAKASSGSVKLETGVLDVNRLVRQVLADWDDRIPEKNKVIKTELAEEPTEISADSGYLYRIVQNLVENAIKYSLDGTRIFVRTRVVDERVYLELINVSAYPIDFDVEAVKERFVRGDASRSTEGNGLGLAIVETFTGALGGKFDISTEGDTFKAVVSFPAMREGEELCSENIGTTTSKHS